MPLILHDLTPIHWAAGGAGIALVTLALLFVANRRLGISTGLEDVCSFVLPVPYFARDAVRSARKWRLPFIAGLVLGGFLSAVLGGGFAPTWDLGMFDQVIGFGHAGKLAWMFAGGLFIGFGTRLAGGCTSGHGIFGMSNFERPSLVSTLSFMAAGILTTQIVYRVLFHAAGTGSAGTGWFTPHGTGWFTPHGTEWFTLLGFAVLCSCSRSVRAFATRTPNSEPGTRNREPNMNTNREPSTRKCEHR